MQCQSLTDKYDIMGDFIPCSNKAKYKIPKQHTLEKQDKYVCGIHVREFNRYADVKGIQNAEKI